MLDLERVFDVIAVFADIQQISQRPVKARAAAFSLKRQTKTVRRLR